MLEPVLSNPWVRAAGVLLAVAGVAFLAYLLSPVLVPLFLAFLVAYSLDPLVDRLEARGLSRTRSIAVFAGIGLIILLSVPLVIIGVKSQAQDLREQAQENIETSGEGEEVKDDPFYYGLLPMERLRGVAEAMKLVPEDKENYDPVSVLAAEGARRVEEQLVEYISGNRAEVASAGQSVGAGATQVIRSIVGWVMGGILFLANFALFSFVAVYLLRDYDDIVATTKDLVPPRFRSKTFELGGKISAQLRGFIRGQMLVCLALGVFYAIGLSLSSVPFAIPIAIFGAVASFIPYMGLALTILPSIVLCLVANQGPGWYWYLGGVVATFSIAQFLEGTFITPKLVGDQVGLGPVWVILAVLVFGSAMGFLGLLLAVPIAATLKVFIVEGLDRYRESEVFGAEELEEVSE